MADVVEINDSYGTYYYIDSSSSRDVLSWAQMQGNATYFYTYASSNYPGWTLNAISAMLGNIQSEGIMNPSQWEYGRNKSTKYGYGLVQWTPATKFLGWADENGISRTSMGGQVERIGWEAANGAQWIETTKWPISFAEFLGSDMAVSDLASAWLYNYERPKNPESTEEVRQSRAETWYKFLSGIDPDPPDPGPPDPGYKAKRMPVYMYPAFR